MKIRRKKFWGKRGGVFTPGLMGRINLARGKTSEDAILPAFEKAMDPVPIWFRRIDKASPEQDRHGIDFVVATDIGNIYLQVKSSDFHAEGFKKRQTRRKYNHYIGVVVIDQHASNPEIIVKRVICATEKVRNELLIERGQAELVSTQEPSV